MRLEDISLYYEVHGNGRPLLLIAGLGSDSSSWSGVTEELSEHFQVIVFDNRGCGQSDPATEGLAVRDMACDAARLLDFLKVKQAHVIGHSMGGYVAQELAINDPSRVAKLVLESTAAVSSPRNNLLLQDIYHQLSREGISESWVRRWTFWLFSPRFFNDRAGVDAFVENALKYPHAQKPDGFRRQMEAIAAFDARERVRAIEIRTLALAGKEDILITPEETSALAESICGSEFRLLDGVAHSIHIEDPKLFTDAVLEFLNAGE